jgi:hypothetical protein
VSQYNIEPLSWWMVGKPYLGITSHLSLESYGYALREELNGKRAAEFLKAHGVIPTCGCNACARGKRLNAQQEKAAQSQTLVSQP